MGIPLIAMTGQATSTLGNTAVECLDTGVDKEACPHNLAPTASTTATLGMGDALAVAVLKSRGFSRDDFARSHPRRYPGTTFIDLRSGCHAHP
ncbi:MAG: hypothetical protein Ct9H300mP14_02190 [Gammaproteobacteria bacterium]|nr:MAG: hypothetical protein Ct9H300mP14_02190 [Gammaproteobacteria bacterium]